MVDKNITQITNDENNFWTSQTVSYSFLSFLPNYFAGGPGNLGVILNNGVAPIGEATKSIIRSILEKISAVTNLTFVEVAQVGNNVGDIAIGVSAVSLGVTQGTTIDYPGTTNGGDIYIAPAYINDEKVILHEILHALGLKHPANYATPPNPAEPGPYLDTFDITGAFTAMGYYPNEQRPTNLGLYDIAVLQHHYGVNSTTANENTLYDLSNTKFLSIWDTGGTDEISIASRTDDLGGTIDLRQGYLSYTTSEILSGVSVAFDTVIENATGSKGMDNLVGNEVANRLFGGNGDDRLFGAGFLADGNADTQYGIARSVDLGQTNIGVDILHGGSLGTAWSTDGKDSTTYINSTTKVDVSISNEGQQTYGGPAIRVVGDTKAGTNLLYSIEDITLTNFNDNVIIEDSLLFQQLKGVKIDGGTGNDTINFSGSTSGTNLDIRPLSPYSIDAVTFENFETIIGSASNDIFRLQGLNPGGALTALQQQQLFDARVLGGPASGVTNIYNKFEGRYTAAGQVTQNQVNVTITGGDGNDVIIGSDTGAVTINGGNGVDLLQAGGYGSVVNGGAGSDFVVGSGFKTQLYGGGTEADLFALSNHSFVMDADVNDYVTWGSFLLSGGTQEWWNESNYAYWTSAASAVNNLGWISASPAAAFFSYAATAISIPYMTTVRYALGESGQLAIQFLRGRGGQAVINDYAFSPDTLQSSGNIAVAKVVFSDNGTLADLRKYLKFAVKQATGSVPQGNDPLVIDLDRDGLELTRQSNGVYFDNDVDQFAEKTAWVKSDDGILVRDINGNGLIDNQGEMFGTATTSGFAALKTYADLNNDNIINATDANFANLRVWRDLNQNGVTDAGELQTLAASGITAISVATTVPTIGAISGNTISAQAIVTYTGGLTGQIADVILTADQADTKFLGTTTITPAAALLPKLKGYGNVKDLQVAMSDGTAAATQLQTLVTSFKALPVTSTWTTLKNAADDIMFKWAGVDGVAKNDNAFNREGIAA